MSLAARLKEAVSASSDRFEKGSKKARIISVCSQKGGVGKTTTSVNLACALTRFHGQKVLVVDLDSQGHVEKALGAFIREGVEYVPISNVLEDKRGNILDAVLKTQSENLHLTPGDKTLTECENILATRIGREFILKNSLRTAVTHYDTIIIDCPPALGNLTLNALAASDYVIVPCEMSVLAFEGVNDLLDTLHEVKDRINPTLDVLGVLFTRVDGRNLTMNKLISDNISKFIEGKKIFRIQIKNNTTINKSQLEGMPIFDFAPNSSGAQNYQSLAKEIVGKMRKKKDVSKK